MKRNSESYEIFARLLSKENIHVSIQDVDTAYFIHNTRELVLPRRWQHLSYEAFTGMSIHEVGHALYTPMKTRQIMVEAGLSNNAYSVLEDVYIERRMKASYPGSRPMLQATHAELWDRGFFGPTPVSKRSFLDRANLFYKVGHHVEIPFTEEEYDVIEMGMGVTRSTYLKIGLKMMAIQKAQAMEKKPEHPETPEESNDGPEDDGPESMNSDWPENNPEDNPDSAPAEETDPEDAAPPEEEDNEDFEPSPQAPESEEEDGEDNGPEMNTDLLDEEDGEESDEGESQDSESGGQEGSEESDDDEESDDSSSQPGGEEGDPSSGEGGEADDDYDAEDEDLESMSEMEKNLADAGGEFDENAPSTMATTSSRVAKKALEDALTWTDSDFLTQFMGIWSNRDFFEKKRWQTPLKPLRKLASHLSSQFEIKKSASAVAMAQTSDTGELDYSQLHRALYDNEIFGEESILYQAQNHGMVVMIDCSGSMSGIKFKAVLQRAIIFGMFARASKIPFSVLGFTSGGNNHTDDADAAVKFGYCNLMEFLSSEQHESVFNKSCAALIHEGKVSEKYGCGAIPMGGTPLNASLLLMREYLRNFSLAHGVEKMSFIVLNDGDSSGLAEGGDNAVRLIDQETGLNLTKLEDTGYRGSSAQVTNNLIMMLKASIPNLNVQNVYVASYAVSHGSVEYVIAKDAKWPTTSQALHALPGRAYDNVICYSAGYGMDDKQSEKMFVNAFMDNFA